MDSEVVRGIRVFLILTVCMKSDWMLLERIPMA